MTKRIPEKVFANNATVAICNDGSIWQFNGLGWQRLPDIPQDSTAENVTEQPYTSIAWGDSYWTTGWKG